MVIALVGATGLVGQVMLKVMEEQDLPCTKLIPCASARSVGKEIIFKGKPYKVKSVEEALEENPQIAIFSAGGSTSLKYAEAFASKGTYVIDNSSAWRADKTVPLVVPEVNSGTINESTKIIANPNCSTIQMVLAIAPIHLQYGIRRMVISTYQSVTGTGVKAVEQLYNERAGKKGEMAYPHPIDLNCFPHGGDFAQNGYTSEEMKLVNETRKILSSPDLKITATVVRIPVMGGHSEAVNLELEKDFDLEHIRQLLGQTPGIILQDDPASNTYPMPRYAEGKDEVFVGRLRRDESIPFGLDMWIVADNLRKGAATNAVQIARVLMDRGFVKDRNTIT